ncbi:energy transducer TonB [Mucilaginibacter agri]|uniref:TonB family protein n=1 Tax=Mucilaginibacter agri TaxID=2695265 RepID=A0A966DTF4_9SPHI|nr:energy transducer TonB [Mucilaginibacter agri]NCD68634.1 TonB family protein [Mucilaginibacter agri]
MSVKKTDISQIRKYLNGELDARAMHKLERQAQDDPFLMDALEGYTGKKDQQNNLDDLQRHLNRRVAGGSKKMVAMWPLVSVAASVLVMLGVGAWWLIAYQPAVNKKLPPTADNTVIARTPVAHATPSPANSAEIKPPIPQHHEEIRPAPVGQSYAANAMPGTETFKGDANAEVRIDEPVGRSDVKAAPEDSAAKDAMLKEVIITGYMTQRKKDITGSVAIVQPIDSQLKGRVEGVTVTSPTLKQRMDSQFITGQVFANDDKLPIPGVSVSVSGKNTATQTDAFGRFKIAATKSDKLNLGYIGFEPKTVNVKGDSLNIVLTPRYNALNEVVVVGYGTQKIIEEAHPVNGWDDFRKYLEDNTTSPDGKEGKVRIRFTVNANNSLSEFKVTKSLSTAADAEAIRIIKEGPKWIHNVSGEAETVTVRINFKK